MATAKDLEQEMRTKLLTTANMKAVVNDLRWQKYINTTLITLGINAALQRKLAKQGYDALTQQHTDVAVASGIQRE